MLLKLLDIFASLSKLRSDFNRIFGGAACTEIHNLTRDLIKSVIERACEIFWEFCFKLNCKDILLLQRAIFLEWCLLL